MNILLRFKTQTAILASALLVGLAVTASINLASAQVENATIQFKKNPSTGLFTISFKDPQGLRELIIKPAGDKLPYGGVLSGCPRSHIIDNSVFNDPVDFDPFLKVTIVDCAGATSEFQVTPPDKGFAVGVLKSKIEAEKKAEEKKKQEEVEKAAAPEEEAAEAEDEEVFAEEDEEESDLDEEEFEEELREEAKASIVYPVAKLSGCKNEAACKSYCDDPDNIEACVAFAEEHGLMKGRELERAKKFSRVADRKGPGGCRGDEECRLYCENSDHLEECINFAEKYGFLSDDELAEAKKILPLIKAGRTPGGCKSKEQCEAYCEKSENMDSCLIFGEENGLIPPEELAMAKKMLPLMKAGATPGGCKNKAQCESYCQNGDNMRVCLAFAEEQGIIPQEELEMAKKFLPLMERGETPGGCKSKEQCEAYCDGEGHFEECIDFGIKTGFIKPEEAEMIKKAGGKGPGGCKSKESCEAYCNEDDHMDECIEFAEKAGILDPEQKKMIEFSKKLGCRSQEECEALCSDPENKQCQELLKEFGMDGGGPEGMGGFEGPGGCGGPEECMAFCQENPEECEGFGPSGGGFPGGGPGAPGGPDEAARKEFYEGVRREHIENVKSDSPDILNCLKDEVGEEVFARRQTGTIKDEAEGRLVKETLEACGAIVGPDRAPTPEDIERIKSQMIPGGSGSMPSENFGSPDQYQQQYQKQYEEQYRQQYEQQYRQQYQQQYQGQYPQ